MRIITGRKTDALSPPARGTLQERVRRTPPRLPVRISSLFTYGSSCKANNTPRFGLHTCIFQRQLRHRQWRVHLRLRSQCNGIQCECSIAIMLSLSRYHSFALTRKFSGCFWQTCLQWCLYILCQCSAIRLDPGYSVYILQNIFSELSMGSGIRNWRVSR